MLPDSPSPRAALALSDLQPQTGASTFSVGTGSGNWSTRGVGGVSGDYMEKSSSGGGMFGNNNRNNNDRYGFGNSNSSSSVFSGNSSSSGGGGGLFSTIVRFDSIRFASTLIFAVSPFNMLIILIAISIIPCVYTEHKLPDCEQIPKVLCCTQRVLDKCMSGCIDYVTEKCPHKLEKYETIASPTETTARPRSQSSSTTTRVIGQVERELKERFIDAKDIRRAPMSGDAKLLNSEYPITEITDADLSSECGTERSQPPFSPCLSRKSADDVFVSCCRQQVPAECHSLCTYEHREHVAAETLIQAVQQEHCDMKHLSAILYCANQNRDNRACCSHLGMSNPELGVGDRCLRMCNTAPSGDRVSSLEKEDLVCLSNWNVIMYCARGGLRTIN
ncbi:unnamed protein product [Caenorhabditis bovis]|uniref:Domain of unknown function DB domain-containing protein n=1 Tax=Caenorhabditis bovis TaxID=2654633 RepID=A0A8S1F869_9PELO|nr:unnamed protein product [Caenorhabditis bovis]